MPHTKIAQRVVIHRHAAAQPPIRIMAVAEAIHLARAADAVHRGVEPQGDQNLGINGRPPRAALARADRRVERRQVEPFDESPHQPRRMAGRQHRLDVVWQQLGLRPVGGLVPRRCVVTAVGRRRGIQVGKEALVAHAPQRSTTAAARKAIRSHLSGFFTDSKFLVLRSPPSNPTARQRADAGLTTPL